MPSMPRPDIHNYDLKYQQTEVQVRNSEISDRNKALIFGYRDACILHGVCGRPRLIRIMGALLLFARLAGKSFDSFTKEDVQALVTKLLAHEPRYTAETLGTYKAITKRFLTWVVNPDAFPSGAPPPMAAWLTGHVKRKDKKRLTRNDLLTPGDIQLVLQHCVHPRDGALVSTLWETGARIAEVGNLQVKHAVPAEHGYTLELDGKTGQRSVLVVSAAPALTAWLNAHPFRSDPEAPLWVHWNYRAGPKQLKYDTIRFLIVDLVKRAGITKRVYPHLFRHSRATYVVATGLMTEAQAKKYFGWAPDSDMLATYAHLMDSDANNAILRENNLTPTTAKVDTLQPVTCYRCGLANPATAEHCTRCAAVLHLAKAYEYQQLHDAKETLLRSMFKLLVEKGMVDDAARQIHDANLGSTLKRLAQHITGEQPFVPPTSVVKEPTILIDATPRS